MKVSIDRVSKRCCKARRNTTASAPERADPHRGAAMEQRWALVAAELLADETVDRGKALALVQAGAWGRHQMLEPAVHALHRSPELLWLVKTLLGPELTANGDYHFRPAVSGSLGVEWGYLHHQESHYYGGSVAAEDGLSVLSLWMPLVDVEPSDEVIERWATKLSLPATRWQKDYAFYKDAQEKLVQVKQMMMEMAAATKRKEAQKLKDEAAKAAKEAAEAEEAAAA